MRKLIAAAMLWPAAALSAGYAIPNENARDLALSQAAVAAQDGPEAVVMNTAALAGQEGLSVSGSVEMLANFTSWSDPVLGSSRTKNHPSFPPAINVAWGGRLPNGMAYGLGAGFLVPGGGSLFWPDDWPGAQRIKYVDQRLYIGRGGAALEPIPGVKLGAALVYYRMTEKLVQGISFAGSPGEASLGLAGGAPSFAVSAELEAPWLPLTLGVDYRHKGNLKLTGKAHFDGVPPSFQPLLQDQGATSYTTVPAELFVGLAYRVIPSLQVMASWSLERWRVYTDDTFTGDKGFTVSVPRNYGDGTVYRLAGEYGRAAALPGVTLRAGLLRSLSDLPTDTLSPTLSDANSWAVSAGVGYEILPGLRADLAYQYAWFDKVTATGPSAFPGSYTTTAHLLAAGVSWRMAR
jgi:long-chain fatty acid transport protein